jgi:streptogramin lyase
VSGKLRLVLAVSALLASLPPAAARAATPEFFPLPEARALNAGMVADSSGNVWFGANGVGAGFTDPPELARLTPSLATPGTSSGISYFHTPKAPEEGCCAFIMRDIAFDAENQRIWFTRSMGVYGYGSLAAMTAGTTNGMQVAIVPGAHDLGGIAVAPGGTAWFAENGASNVGPAYTGNRIASTDASLLLNEYPDLWHQTGVPADSSRFDAGPAGVTIGKDGAPWFAEDNPGLPGYRLARASGGLYQEYQVKPCAPTPPCSGSNTGTGVLSVATAPDGSIWFTNVIKNSFGKFDPANSTFTQYDMAGIDADLAGGQPRVIRAAPDGTLWLVQYGGFSLPKANAIVRIVPSDPPTTTVYKLGAGKAPLSLAPDSKGNVWFGVTDSSTSSVGRLAGVLGAPLSPGDPGAGAPGAGLPGRAVIPPGEKVVKAAGTGFARVNDPELRQGALRLTQICVGPPQDRCSLIYLLDSHEYVNGFPGTKPRARTTKRVVVGSKAVTIAGGESETVTVKLNAKGKAILKRDGVLHLTFHASQKQAKGKTKVLKTKKLTIKAPSK